MAIQLEKVSFTYAQRMLWRHTALHDISLHLPRGGLTGIAGATGSGKSTLLQLFNGLLKPSEGTVRVLDVAISAGERSPKLTPLRRRVGLVFQFPEQQLFQDTVEKELLFGPLNFGVDPETARQRARRAMTDMGLDPELLERNPFRLSGGQMRKVAIASVLAMDPEILVLDEPTATLDPVSREELVGLLVRLCREQGVTVLVVTHRMDELLPFADRWLLLQEGRLAFEGNAGQLAADPSVLERCGLAVPPSLRYWKAIAERSGRSGEAVPDLTAAGLAEAIAGLMPPLGHAEQGKRDSDE